MGEPAVPDRYRKLVHLLARAFYGGQCPPPDPEQLAAAAAGARKKVGAACAWQSWLQR